MTKIEKTLVDANVADVFENASNALLKTLSSDFYQEMPPSPDMVLKMLKKEFRKQYEHRMGSNPFRTRS